MASEQQGVPGRDGGPVFGLRLAGGKLFYRSQNDVRIFHENQGVDGQSAGHGAGDKIRVLLEIKNCSKRDSKV